MIGAVAGALAPSLYDGLRERGARQEAWQGTVETALPLSRARLLDPRREVVGFVGREGELAELTAWCQGEQSGRLRLVTGPGGGRQVPVGGRAGGPDADGGVAGGAGG